ncbi:hypothetical protein V8C34DRAFT_112151 [Trichoderma compactum]
MEAGLSPCLFGSPNLVESSSSESGLGCSSLYFTFFVFLQYLVVFLVSHRRVFAPFFLFSFFSLCCHSLFLFPQFLNISFCIFPCFSILGCFNYLFLL